MNKILQYTTIAAVVVSSVVLTAFRPGEPSNYSFKSVDEEVEMEVERGKAEVFLHLFIKDVNQYDHILIERSNENESNFGKCKYITCSEKKDAAMLEVDKYPYTASKDVYYRIRTITKDGIERIYPAVLLAGAAQ